MPTRIHEGGGSGRRKPPVGSMAVAGHPLAPFCALLYNEGGGAFGRAWSRTGATNITAGINASVGFGQTPDWCADGVHFSGSETQMLTGDAPLHLNRNFSVVARALTRTTATGALVSWPVSGYYLRFAGTSPKLDFLQSRVVDIITGATTLALNRYYTCGATVSAGSTATCRIYLDGVQDGSATFSGTFSSANTIRIGADTTGSSNNAGSNEVLSGRIAWIYWYDRELTAPEMMAIHHAPFAWLSAGPPRRNFSNGPGPVTSYPGSMLCHL